MTDLSPSSVRALVERLRGYNPPDRTTDEYRQASIDIHEAATALLALLERVEAAEADAARYRWLRDQLWEQALTTVYVLPIVWRVDYKGEEGGSMDAAIDAARGAER